MAALDPSNLFPPKPQQRRGFAPNYDFNGQQPQTDTPCLLHQLWEKVQVSGQWSAVAADMAGARFSMVASLFGWVYINKQR